MKYIPDCDCWEFLMSYNCGKPAKETKDEFN